MTWAGSGWEGSAGVVAPNLLPRGYQLQDVSQISSCRNEMKTKGLSPTALRRACNLFHFVKTARPRACNLFHLFGGRGQVLEAIVISSASEEFVLPRDRRHDGKSSWTNETSIGEELSAVDEA
jgi:hypothetical protein